MLKCVSENCDYYNQHKECSSVCLNRGIKKIVSNADRIRSMSDEKLAHFILTKAQWFSNSDHCIVECHKENYCDKCVLDWLQKEAAQHE